MITLTEAKSRGVYFHSQGFTCAQSVVKAYSEYVRIDCSQLVSATIAFGSGLNSGCVCGSLAGAEMLIGLKYANEPATAKMKSKLFHDKFRERFGATCCRVIRGKEKGICSKTIEFAIELLDSL